MTAIEYYFFLVETEEVCGRSDDPFARTVEQTMEQIESRIQKRPGTFLVTLCVILSDSLIVLLHCT